MLKYNLTEIKATKNDAYVSDAVMIFADEKNIFEGTILEKCARDLDVIMINLKAGETIKQHKHITSEEIVLVLNGSGKIFQADKAIVVKKDDIVFLEKNIKHGFEADSEGLKLLAFHGPPMHERV